MRLTYAALAWLAGTAAIPAGIADETLSKAECWLVFEGFAQQPILSAEAPEGILASVKDGDVIDVIELMSLKGAVHDQVVRIYELRDATKFMCRMERL